MAGPSETQAYLIFAVGTVAMLFMAGAIIIFVSFYQKRMLNEQLRRQAMEADYQRKLLEAQLESQERERARVSKDLHDDVGLMLQALRTTTLAVIHQAPEEDRQEVQQMVSEITESVRRISWDLMPSSLERFGLTETIDELCTRLNKRGLPVHFSLTGVSQALSKRNEVLLYRMTQEMVNNALKHAKAAAIDVNLQWTEDQLQLQVTDNGVGFELPTSVNYSPIGSGLGLLSLKSRADLLNAQLTFEKNSPSGTRISVKFPIPHGQN
ncbi:MAG: sensor histidine kinase [Cyclobacteriaceae bacterium]|jgi:two-component system NarL family sensor kinase